MACLKNLNSASRYFRARFYHAQLGRFISRDPIGYVDGMSLYRAYFVPGAVDPSGKETWDDCFTRCAYGGVITVPTVDTIKRCTRLCNRIGEEGPKGTCSKEGEHTDTIKVPNPLPSRAELCAIALKIANENNKPCLDEARKKCKDSGGVFEITKEWLSTPEKLEGLDMAWRVGDPKECRVRFLQKNYGTDGGHMQTYCAAVIVTNVNYKCKKWCPRDEHGNPVLIKSK